MHSARTHTPFKPEVKLYRDNVLNTIEKYREGWGVSGGFVSGNTSDDVLFLDDGACRVVIQNVEPRLTSHFDNETRGDHKADI